METVIKKNNWNFQCDKCNSDVTVVTETVGIFSGDSGLPLKTFNRETCHAFPQVLQCRSCDYCPSF